MIYSEEEFLQLSGIQHFKFCRRQWALIHIEQQWAENYRTIDGALMHKNAHDAQFQESRGNLFITRGVSVFSSTLGVPDNVMCWNITGQTPESPSKARKDYGSPTL